MSTDYQFRPDLKNKAKAPFDRIASRSLPQTPRTQMRTRVNDAIEKRAAQTRRTLRAHLEKMKPQWIAREEGRLRRTNSMRMAHARNSGPKPPYGVSNAEQSHSQSVREKARANVTRRSESRMRQLDSIERRMKRDLTRSQRRSR